MEKNQIVPDVIDTVPKYIIDIKYANGSTVNMGNELTPTQAKEMPIEITWPIEEGALYTLCMTDPDAPSRETPKFREVNHWLIVNIPGNDLSKGEMLAEYIGPGPPKDSGLHRYLFLVYKQPSKLTTDEPILTIQRQERLNFKIKNFAKKYQLKEPIAGNFFMAQFENVN